MRGKELMTYVGLGLRTLRIVKLNLPVEKVVEPSEHESSMRFGSS